MWFSYYNDKIEVYHEGKKSHNAEVAIWDEKGNWITKEVMLKLQDEHNDDVVGYVDVNQWLEILDICRRSKKCL